MNSLHDVMAPMTRRFEELLVKQDEHHAKQFAELFDVSFKKIGHSAQIDDAVIDLTEHSNTGYSCKGAIHRRSATR